MSENGMADAFRHYFDVGPFGFQLATARGLLDDRNVLLQAPTGAGKTRAAIFPWLYARDRGIPFADRLIYALPLRTLTSALYEDTRALLEKRAPDVRVTIQMGTDAQDSFFHKGDIIFTTIDQLLSAYIGAPVSLSPRLANLPAGALIGAYVVFDEFHLLEPEKALSTALDLARRFRDYTRMLLMTATFPESARAAVESHAMAVPVQVPSDELRQIPSQQNKRRRFEWHGRPMDAADIVDAHGGRTIAVVNRVERAQDLYEEVSALLKGRSMGERPELLLLHARFLPQDRAEIERRIEDLFKEGSSGNAILIATQVVEVGLDISADVMHSEISPASSLFQRAGRCARFRNEKGTVHVYALPLDDQGNPRYGPYLGETERSLVDATAGEIESHSGEDIGYVLERSTVDRVHGQADLDAVGAVKPRTRSDEVEHAIMDEHGSWVATLIRSIDSIGILVHDDPDRLRLDLRPEMFSVDRGVFKDFLRRISLHENPPLVQIPQFADDEKGWGSVEWEPATDKKTVGSGFMACVHPAVVSYSDKLGLRFGRAGTFRSKETVEVHDADFPPYVYHIESYGTHVANALEKAARDGKRCGVGLRRLASQLEIAPEDVERLARLAVALHDVGKLSEEWQDAIWLWQSEVFGTVRDRCLAHSDYDGSNTAQRARNKSGKYRKPPHAAEGAFASLPILAAAVREVSAEETAWPIIWALATAITRHHGAHTRSLSEFGLDPQARAEVSRSIAEFNVPVRLQACTSKGAEAEFKSRLVEPTSPTARVYPLYLFVARRIRLADQESLAGG